MNKNTALPIWGRLSALIFPSDLFADDRPRTQSTSTPRHIFYDLIFITLVVLAFCSFYFSVGSQERLPGLEADVFQSLDWTLLRSLSQGSFPLWNPYLDTGLPYIADPMLHAYNPLVSLPVLLFGVWQGFKIALTLSFLMAALGMYALARSLGLSRILRIWLALMFAFAGQPVARFFQGQYLFILGFAWIPWIFFAYTQALRTRQRWAAALTVVSAAMLFFSGNAYYAFLTLISLGILTLVWVIQVQRVKPRIQWDRKRLHIALLIGFVSLLLISIQLLPTIDFLPYVNKAADVQGFHNLAQIFLDLTSKDPNRPDAFTMLPAREEYYAYIGYIPFFGLLAVPFARRPQRHWIISLVFILIFTVSWISLDRMPWYGWLVSQPVTLMFRHLLRALLFTSFSILILAALGYQRLLEITKQWSIRDPRASGSRWVNLLRKVPLTLLVLVLLLGLIDLFLTNRAILEPWDRPEELYEVMATVRELDPDDIYVRNNPNNQGHDAIIANGLRFMMPWYHYTEIRNMRGETRQYFRPLAIQPHYLVARTTNWLPDDLDWTLFRKIDEWRVVKLDDSLPMAFTVDEEKLIGGGHQPLLGYAEVIEQDMLWEGPNRSETIVRGRSDQLFVSLVSYHPDWRIRIDGKRVESLNVSGLLGVKTLSGLHKYEFAFIPTWFFVGLVLTAFGSLIVGYWLRDHFSGILAGVRVRITRLPQQLQTFWSEMSSDSVEKRADPPLDISTAWQAWRTASGKLLQTLFRSISWQAALFLLGLGLYLASRLIQLETFPIYFFSDEAVQTVLAADLVRDDFYGYDGIYLPTYFENASLFNLSTSVYLQVLPFLLFGKSIVITRATPALITATAVIALALILKRGFDLRYWWTAPFALGLIPTWFLHSRTAFETTLFVSFTAWALYFYIDYRQGRRWSLLAAMLFGALGFYSYAGAQIVLGVFGLLLALIDWRYHRKNARILVAAGFLALMLIYPYLRFRAAHASETYFHLRRLDSYWYHEISPWTKVLTFFGQYLQGLNPVYWFARFPDDLSRHLMLGYGRISIIAAPFLIYGLYLAIRNIKSPPHRTVVLLLLCAPLGAAIISIGITRLLLVVIPAAVFISVGYSEALNRLKAPLLRSFIIITSFVLLALAQVFMLSDSVKNGPTWYRDYGLAGMQYGAKQVFGAADKVASQPGISRVYVSPTWANGTDILLRFFLPDGGPVGIANAGPFLEMMQPNLLAETIFVLTPSEYRELITNPKVGEVDIDRILPFPDGHPGFYFVHFSYSDEAEIEFAQEQTQREAMQNQAAQYRGTTFIIEYPYTDMGELKHIFDDDAFTLMRFYGANPARLTLSFDEPVNLEILRVTTGSMDIQLTARVYTDGSESPREFSERYVNLPDDPEVQLTLGSGIDDITRLEIEIMALGVGSPFKIHIRDLSFE